MIKKYNHPIFPNGQTFKDADGNLLDDCFQDSEGDISFLKNGRLHSESRSAARDRYTSHQQYKNSKILYYCICNYIVKQLIL